MPIMENLIEMGEEPRVTKQGCKLVTMNVPRLRLFFRDSFNFLQSSLDKLPETFNLETRSKGHFPHLFNRREKWHAENIDKGFLLEREMATYCKSFII
jgi:hypothetical protein